MSRALVPGTQREADSSEPTQLSCVTIPGWNLAQKFHCSDRLVTALGDEAKESLVRRSVRQYQSIESIGFSEDGIVNKFTGIYVLGISFVCMALCASCGSSPNSTQTGSPARNPHSGTADMLCFTSPDARKVVVSGVFPVKTYPPERMIEAPWAQDFRRYIGQSGSEGGINVTCSAVQSSDAARVKAEELRKQGHEVVETKWSYAGG